MSNVFSVIKLFAPKALLFSIFQILSSVSDMNAKISETSFKNENDLIDSLVAVLDLSN